MRLPRPAPKTYLGTIATVLATIAVIQYVGVFFEASGELDLTYLATIGLILPFSTYLLAVVTENVAFLPGWDEMNRSEQ
ncbi:hypothetical protein [Halorussus halobius]|uniref:hypothetical protein n=1 Tax=Halorussus halobius TaxID=1710537 RepID=UPI0010919113|nr:hypothetical protein [Halorussus halobius]